MNTDATIQRWIAEHGARFTDCAEGWMIEYPRHGTPGEVLRLWRGAGMFVSVFRNEGCGLWVVRPCEHNLFSEHADLATAIDTAFKVAAEHHLLMASRYAGPVSTAAVFHRLRAYVWNAAIEHAKDIAGEVLGYNHAVVARLEASRWTP